MLRVNDWLPYNARGTAAAQQTPRHRHAVRRDGALYMARYPVGCCRNNTSATSQEQIVKISFNVYEESVAPMATVAFDPATPGNGRTYTGPVTLNFTSTDSAGANPTVAGVDYIEHRVTLNGVPGPWERSTNAGIVNPYTSTMSRTENGAYVVEYRTADRGGNVGETKSVSFWINRPTVVKAGVSAIVPSTLGLAVSSTVLGPFIPGVAQTYTGAATATVTSSWPNATLTVSDSDTATATTGRMANGASVIPQALEVLNNTAAFQTIGATPRTVATWATQVAGVNVPITLQQRILATHVLVAGQYSKELTFSLSTTTP